MKSLRAQPVDGFISVCFSLTFTSESRMIQRHINNKKQTETEIQKKKHPQNYKKKYTQRDTERAWEKGLEVEGHREETIWGREAGKEGEIETCKKLAGSPRMKTNQSRASWIKNSRETTKAHCFVCPEAWAPGDIGSGFLRHCLSAPCWQLCRFSPSGSNVEWNYVSLEFCPPIFPISFFLACLFSNFPNFFRFCFFPKPDV